MSFSFSKEAIEELKNQIDIVDVIGRSVELKRAGANYKGLCPFHNEKTPSFIVSPQKQIFTCFGGCGASGDVVSFVEKYYNLDFNEAVQKLADEYGITLQKTTYNDDREKYYQINREAARFFYRNLTEKKNPGYTYMQKRGIKDSIIKKFGLGYAEDSWNSLYDYFKSKGTDEKILVELGLLSQKGDRYYDKFRNRVIFPIINTAGKVIGFGGRAINSEDMPKYLNSPENRVFQKKNNLYALNITRQDIGKTGNALIVEGYMDVISLYQNGVKNVAASLGTALTENQAKLINRYTKNVILSYDADAAGQKAALRGIEVLRGENCKVKVLHVNDGKDPDEYIKKNGKEAFLKLTENALPYIDYKIEAAKRGLDIQSEVGKIDYMKRISSILSDLSPVECDIYIKKVSRETGISESAIKLEIRGNNKKEQPLRHKNTYETVNEETEKLTALEATLLKCLFIDPEFSEKLLPYTEVFESVIGQKTLNTAFELYGLNGDFTESQVTDRLEPSESEELFVALNKVIITGNEKEVLKQCIHKWKFMQLAKKEKELRDILSLADESNKDSIDKITMELMEIQKEMKAHGGKM
ncbi:MAG: DNA primase [Anaerovoracaceae bacterium]|nr:DNA primase [Bacillota bacterium]MEE0517338.1 DNA primase [Anaerovoracaceae bacterium]